MAWSLKINTKASVDKSHGEVHSQSIVSSAIVHTQHATLAESCALTYVLVLLWP